MRMRSRHAPKGQRAHSPGHRPGYDEAAQQKYPGGYSQPYGVSLSSLFPYPEQDWRFRCQFCPSQTQCTATAPAVHCNRSRSALQPPLQCTASVLAVHCILHASTSNLSRKYVHRSPQVRASEIGFIESPPCFFY